MLHPPPAYLTPTPLHKQEINAGNATGYQCCTHQSPASERFLVTTLNDPVAAFTGLLAVATTGLWIFTALMWKATKRTVEDAAINNEKQGSNMRSSIDEAARAASAMEKVARAMELNSDQVLRSIKNQELFGKIQLRAHISVLIGGGIYQERDLRFQADPTILNSGHTPARDLRYKIAAAILPVPIPEHFGFPLPQGPAFGSNLLGPGRDAILSAVVEAQIDEADVPMVRAGIGRSLYVWGFLKYADVFGKTHRCTFAQQIYWQQSGLEGSDGRTPYTVRGRYLSKHNRSN